MNTSRKTSRLEDESITAWLERTAGNNLSVTDIPQVKGRSQAGWQQITVKIPADLSTLIDRLMEHPALRGMWETRAQAGYALMQLGCHAMARFLDGKWKEDDRVINSIQYKLAQYTAEHNEQAQRMEITRTAQTVRQTADNYLNWKNKEGDYRAFKILDSALETRKWSSNPEQFDRNFMDMSGQSLNLSWSKSSPAAQYYYRMLHGQYEDVMLELTQGWIDEVESLAKSKD